MLFHLKRKIASRCRTYDELQKANWKQISIFPLHSTGGRPGTGGHAAQFQLRSYLSNNILINVFDNRGLETFWS